jgi:hypothetical protein
MWLHRWFDRLIHHERPAIRAKRAADLRAHTVMRDLAYERVMERMRAVDEALRKARSESE